MYHHALQSLWSKITHVTDMKRHFHSTEAMGRAILCVASILLLVTPTSGTVAALDNCMTLQTEILVHKEKIYDYNGRRVRLICAGNIEINKCEGYCLSQVSPSVVQFPGFKKDCKCCRESHLATKHVTLHNCYDGNQLVPGQEVSLAVKEPMACQCFPCAM